MNKFNIICDDVCDSNVDNNCISDIRNDEQLYVGWIDCRVASRELLISLGVKGKIKKYQDKTACVYNHCTITEKLAMVLNRRSSYFYIGAFTAIDKNGEQLPREQQKLWSSNNALIG
jgi:hypothetical protein